jgi:hypothetical protein
MRALAALLAGAFALPALPAARQATSSSMRMPP